MAGNYSAFSLLHKSDARHLYKDFDSILRFFRPRKDALFTRDFDIDVLTKIPEILQKYLDYLNEQKDFQVITNNVGPRVVKSVILSMTAWLTEVVKHNSEKA